MTVFFNISKVILAILLLSSAARSEEIINPTDFMNQVSKQNLDIRLAQTMRQEVKSQSSGIKIPPPMVSLSQMNMANGQTSKGWQVSQTIPFPTKIKNDYSARKYALKAQEKEEQVMQQEVLSQAKLVYFLVWVSQEEKALLNEKKEVLSKHIQIAKSVAQSDTFAKIHLLKAESELDRLENEIEVISQTHQERLSMAAELLDQDPQTFKFKAINPGLSQPPKLSSINETPQVQAMDQRLKSYESLEKAGKSQWYPDFTLSYNHMDETMRFPENNQIMVGMTLPFLYFWQSNSESNVSSAQRQKTEINLHRTKRSIEAQKVNLEKSIQTLKNQMATLNDKILPRAKKRKGLFQNVAPRDLSSLQEHLDTHLSIPNIRLQHLAFQSQYEQVVAELSKYKTDTGGTN